MKSSSKSFEHFYLTRVALGDCCGCAERVIDWRDIEQAASARQQPVDNIASKSLQKNFTRRGIVGNIARLIRRFGFNEPVGSDTTADTIVNSTANHTD